MMDLTVKDTQGVPLGDVSVSYGICAFDSATANDGWLGMNVPRLDGEIRLELVRGDTIYDVYTDAASLENGLTVDMPLLKSYNVHFQTVTMSGNTMVIKDATDTLTTADVTLVRNDGRQTA